MTTTIKHYVLAEERKQLRQEAVNRAIISIRGPVGFYEHWPGEEPCLTVTEEALQSWRYFCKLVWKDAAHKELCQIDYEERAKACKKPQISLCWLGIHNLVCPVKDEHGCKVTLLGGEFRVRERKAETEEYLEQFLQDIPLEDRETFRDAWRKIPEISEAEALGSKMRELELAGRGYLYSLKRLSDFRYSADLVTHDVVIALQALIAEVEVLKIELDEAFHIGRKWENRFEAIIKICEDHHSYLEKRLRLEKPRFTYASISKLIHECIDSYLPQANTRGIKFQVDLEQAVDEQGEHKVLLVRMDQVALRQALGNVIDNAIKYSFSGTVNQTRWINVVGRLQALRGIQGYSIFVSNLGIGIEEDELELVFEPGYQGKRRFDESRSGYGIGLTFVKECIENHGGGVAISSQRQQGTGWLTTLNIWLPLRGPTERQAGEV